MINYKNQKFLKAAKNSYNTRKILKRINKNVYLKQFNILLKLTLGVTYKQTLSKIKHNSIYYRYNIVNFIYSSI